MMCGTICKLLKKNGKRGKMKRPRVEANMNHKYPVSCPLLGNKSIDEYTCFEIHTVVQETSPKSIAPKEIFEFADYKEKCRNCKYHRNDA